MGTHRRPKPPTRPRLAVLAASAGAFSLLPTAQSQAEPKPSIEKVRQEIEELYHDSEASTEEYRTRYAAEWVRSPPRSTGRGGLDPSVQLFLSADPDDYLTQAARPHEFPADLPAPQPPAEAAGNRTDPHRGTEEAQGRPQGPGASEREEAGDSGQAPQGPKAPEQPHRRTAGRTQSRGGQGRPGFRQQRQRRDLQRRRQWPRPYRDRVRLRPARQAVRVGIDRPELLRLLRPDRRLLACRGRLAAPHGQPAVHRRPPGRPLGPPARRHHLLVQRQPAQRPVRRRRQGHPRPAHRQEHRDPAELTRYCLSALTAARTLPSEAAVRRLVTVTLAGVRPPQH
jgi:hypothetical protein